MGVASDLRMVRTLSQLVLFARFPESAARSAAAAAAGSAPAGGGAGSAGASSGRGTGRPSPVRLWRRLVFDRLERPEGSQPRLSDGSPVVWKEDAGWLTATAVDMQCRELRAAAMRRGGPEAAAFGVEEAGALLGITRWCSGWYVIMAAPCPRVGSLGRHPVLGVTEVIVVPVSWREAAPTGVLASLGRMLGTDALRASEKRFRASIRAALAKPLGLFFSRRYDLTRPLQNQMSLAVAGAAVAGHDVAAGRRSAELMTGTSDVTLWLAEGSPENATKATWGTLAALPRSAAAASGEPSKPAQPRAAGAPEQPLPPASRPAAGGAPAASGRSAAAPPAHPDPQVSCPPREMFVWNHALLEPLCGTVSPGWAAPVICGSFGQVTVTSFSKALVLSLVSRRSRHFAGTRYLKRGVSRLGFVANEVELEQVVDDTSGGMAAFVQHRGSVPLPWTQRTNLRQPKPPIDLSPPDFTSLTGARQHFASLLARHGAPVLCLNLLRKGSRAAREGPLGAAFADAVKTINTTMPPALRLQFASLDFASLSKSRSHHVLTALRASSEWAVANTGVFVAAPGKSGSCSAAEAWESGGARLASRPDPAARSRRCALCEEGGGLHDGPCTGPGDTQASGAPGPKAGSSRLRGWGPWWDVDPWSPGRVPLRERLSPASRATASGHKASYLAPVWRAVPLSKVSMRWAPEHFVMRARADRARRRRRSHADAAAAQHHRPAHQQPLPGASQHPSAPPQGMAPALAMMGTAAPGARGGLVSAEDVVRAFETARPSAAGVGGPRPSLSPSSAAAIAAVRASTPWRTGNRSLAPAMRAACGDVTGRNAPAVLAAVAASVPGVASPALSPPPRPAAVCDEDWSSHAVLAGSREALNFLEEGRRVPTSLRSHGYSYLAAIAKARRLSCLAPRPAPLQSAQSGANGEATTVGLLLAAAGGRPWQHRRAAAVAENDRGRPLVRLPVLAPSLGPWAPSCQPELRRAFDSDTAAIPSLPLALLLLHELEHSARTQASAANRSLSTGPALPGAASLASPRRPAPASQSQHTVWQAFFGRSSPVMSTAVVARSAAGSSSSDIRGVQPWPALPVIAPQQGLDAGSPLHMASMPEVAASLKRRAASSGVGGTGGGADSTPRRRSSSTHGSKARRRLLFAGTCASPSVAAWLAELRRRLDGRSPPKVSRLRARAWSQRQSAVSTAPQAARSGPVAFMHGLMQPVVDTDVAGTGAASSSASTAGGDAVPTSDRAGRASAGSVSPASITGGSGIKGLPTVSPAATMGMLGTPLGEDPLAAAAVRPAAAAASSAVAQRLAAVRRRRSGPRRLAVQLGATPMGASSSFHSGAATPGGASAFARGRPSFRAQSPMSPSQPLEPRLALVVHDSVCPVPCLAITAPVSASDPHDSHAGYFVPSSHAAVPFTFPGPSTAGPAVPLECRALAAVTGQAAPPVSSLVTGWSAGTEPSTLSPPDHHEKLRSAYLPGGVMALITAIAAETARAKRHGTGSKQGSHAFAFAHHRGVASATSAPAGRPVPGMAASLSSLDRADDLARLMPWPAAAASIRLAAALGCSTPASEHPQPSPTSVLRFGGLVPPCGLSLGRESWRAAATVAVSGRAGALFSATGTRTVIAAPGERADSELPPQSSGSGQKQGGRMDGSSSGLPAPGGLPTSSAATGGAGREAGAQAGGAFKGPASWDSVPRSALIAAAASPIVAPASGGVSGLAARSLCARVLSVEAVGSARSKSSAAAASAAASAGSSDPASLQSGRVTATSPGAYLFVDGEGASAAGRVAWPAVVRDGLGGRGVPAGGAVFFQSGIVRSNCVDCLDRTSVAQAVAGIAALGPMLAALGWNEAGSVVVDATAGIDAEDRAPGLARASLRKSRARSDAALTAVEVARRVQQRQAGGLRAALACWRGHVAAGRKPPAAAAAAVQAWLRQGAETTDPLSQLLRRLYESAADALALQYGGSGANKRVDDAEKGGEADDEAKPSMLTGVISSAASGRRAAAGAGTGASMGAVTAAAAGNGSRGVTFSGKVVMAVERHLKNSMQDAARQRHTDALHGRLLPAHGLQAAALLIAPPRLKDDALSQLAAAGRDALAGAGPIGDVSWGMWAHSQPGSAAPAGALHMARWAGGHSSLQQLSARAAAMQTRAPGGQWAARLALAAASDVAAQWEVAIRAAAAVAGAAGLLSGMSPSASLMGCHDSATRTLGHDAEAAVLHALRSGASGLQGATTAAARAAAREVMDCSWGPFKGIPGLGTRVAAAKAVAAVVGEAAGAAAQLREADAAEAAAQGSGGQSRTSGPAQRASLRAARGAWTVWRPGPSAVASAAAALLAMLLPPPAAAGWQLTPASAAPVHAVGKQPSAAARFPRRRRSRAATTPAASLLRQASGDGPLTLIAPEDSPPAPAAAQPGVLRGRSSTAGSVGSAMRQWHRVTSASSMRRSRHRAGSSNGSSGGVQRSVSDRRLHAVRSLASLLQAASAEAPSPVAQGFRRRTAAFGTAPRGPSPLVPPDDGGPAASSEAASRLADDGGHAAAEPAWSGRGNEDSLGLERRNAAGTTAARPVRRVLLSSDAALPNTPTSDGESRDLAFVTPVASPTSSRTPHFGPVRPRPLVAGTAERTAAVSAVLRRAVIHPRLAAAALQARVDATAPRPFSSRAVPGESDVIWWPGGVGGWPARELPAWWAARAVTAVNEAAGAACGSDWSAAALVVARTVDAAAGHGAWSAASSILGKRLSAQLRPSTSDAWVRGGDGGVTYASAASDTAALAASMRVVAPGTHWDAAERLIAALELAGGSEVAAPESEGAATREASFGSDDGDAPAWRAVLLPSAPGGLAGTMLGEARAGHAQAPGSPRRPRAGSAPGQGLSAAARWRRVAALAEPDAVVLRSGQGGSRDGRAPSLVVQEAPTGRVGAPQPLRHGGPAVLAHSGAGRSIAERDEVDSDSCDSGDALGAHASDAGGSKREAAGGQGEDGSASPPRALVPPPPPRRTEPERPGSAAGSSSDPIVRAGAPALQRVLAPGAPQSMALVFVLNRRGGSLVPGVGAQIPAGQTGVVVTSRRLSLALRRDGAEDHARGASFEIATCAGSPRVRIVPAGRGAGVGSVAMTTVQGARGVSWAAHGLRGWVAASPSTTAAPGESALRSVLQHSWCGLWPIAFSVPVTEYVTPPTAAAADTDSGDGNPPSPSRQASGRRGSAASMTAFARRRTSARHAVRWDDAASATSARQDAPLRRQLPRNDLPPTHPAVAAGTSAADTTQAGTVMPGASGSGTVALPPSSHPLSASGGRRSRSSTGNLSALSGRAELRHGRGMGGWALAKASASPEAMARLEAEADRRFGLLRSGAWLERPATSGDRTYRDDPAALTLSARPASADARGQRAPWMRRGAAGSSADGGQLPGGLVADAPAHGVAGWSRARQRRLAAAVLAQLGPEPGLVMVPDAAAPLLRPGAAARVLEARGISVPVSSGGIGTAGESPELDTEFLGGGMRPAGDPTAAGAAAGTHPLTGSPRRCAPARARAIYGVYVAVASAVSGRDTASAERLRQSETADTEAWEHLRPMSVAALIVPAVTPADAASYATAAHACQPLLPPGLAKDVVTAARAGIAGCFGPLSSLRPGSATQFCKSPLTLAGLRRAAKAAPTERDALSRWQCGAGCDTSASSARLRAAMASSSFLEGLSGPCGVALGSAAQSAGAAISAEAKAWDECIRGSRAAPVRVLGGQRLVTPPSR